VTARPADLDALTTLLQQAFLATTREEARGALAAAGVGTY
jgi:crotonobetainyl-CoA:carnitine CoA-transferase CaiB-like acyl-CoA transferase